MGDHMDRYEQEKRVAEYYATIGEVVRSTWRIKDLGHLLRTFAEQTGLKFGWHTTAIILKRGSRLHLNSYFQHNEIHLADESVALSGKAQGLTDVILEAINHQQVRQSKETIVSFPILNAAEDPVYFAAIPLNNRESLIGLLVLSRTTAAFDGCEIDIFHDLADHISLAIDNVSLYEENEQLLLAEVRSSLARDLHDSVNQKLFSLSLVAQGLRMRAGQKDKAIESGLLEIGELAQEALAEMKSLVLDLHPHVDNNTLGELLEQHAIKLDLKLLIIKGRNLRFSSRMEKALWRIGQEALNNVKKHASVDYAEVEITCDDRYVHMHITDHGCGFQQNVTTSGKLGLTSMRERILQLNGQIDIRSEEAIGTTITVRAPLESGGRR
ncbi:sensor histidine kinase [Paenibacillaceae bacterium]|nr:sensor histidine kinase [Paenibacillaceae bacterium]